MITIATDCRYCKKNQVKNDETKIIVWIGDVNMIVIVNDDENASVTMCICICCFITNPTEILELERCPVYKSHFLQTSNKSKLAFLEGIRIVSEHCLSRLIMCWYVRTYASIFLCNLKHN